MRRKKNTHLLEGAAVAGIGFVMLLVYITAIAAPWVILAIVLHLLGAF